MPIIAGKQPAAWNDSAARPTHDFSFLRGGGISGGGAPVEFQAARTKNREEEKEAERLRKQALEGENLSEMAVEEVLDSDSELGVSGWTAPVLDVAALLPAIPEQNIIDLIVFKLKGTDVVVSADDLNGISNDDVDITYNSDGSVNTIVNNAASTTETLTYAKNKVTSYSDGTDTWNFTYDGEQNVTKVLKA